MSLSTLTFFPIDWERDRELVLKFRADSFVCSFGSADRFDPERYLREAPQRIAELPGSFVHVWLGKTIVGQIELGRWKEDPSIGYVSLFYLAPDYRGRGLAAQPEQYAEAFFRRLGVVTARLSANPNNFPAIKFYTKQGWRDLGERPGHPDVHYFEKTYPNS